MALQSQTENRATTRATSRGRALGQQDPGERGQRETREALTSVPYALTETAEPQSELGGSREEQGQARPTL